MKYIRTKDGKIIKFNTSDVEEEIAGIKYDILGFRLKMTMLSYGLEKEDIIKISNTIEELCDEFVVIVPTEKPDFVVDFSKNKQTFVKAKLDVFGAIWTDKGLIYVAKMNDKGELKLL